MSVKPASNAPGEEGSETPGRQEEVESEIPPVKGSAWSLYKHTNYTVKEKKGRVIRRVNYTERNF